MDNFHGIIIVNEGDITTIKKFHSNQIMQIVKELILLLMQYITDDWFGHPESVQRSFEWNQRTLSPCQYCNLKNFLVKDDTFACHRWLNYFDDEPTYIGIVLLMYLLLCK